jgi:hypothetical protein
MVIVRANSGWAFRVMYDGGKPEPYICRFLIHLGPFLIAI